MPDSPLVRKAEVAGAGFINLFLDNLHFLVERPPFHNELVFLLDALSLQLVFLHIQHPFDLGCQLVHIYHTPHNFAQCIASCWEYMGYRMQQS